MLTPACKILVVTAVLTVFPVGLTGFPPDAHAEARRFSETVPFEPGGHLEISTGRGSLELSTWDRNEVEIVARIESPVNINPVYATEIVSALRIEVKDFGRTLRIRSNYDNIPDYKQWFITMRYIPYVHFQVRTPRLTHVALDVRHTDTRVQDVEGAIRIQAHYCDIKGVNWKGRARLDMDHGTLRLRGLEVPVELDADQTDVFMDLTRLGGPTRIRAHRGRVELYLPSHYGFELYSDISHESELDSDFEIPTGDIERDEGIISGAINGGGSLLDLRGRHTSFRLRSGSL